MCHVKNQRFFTVANRRFANIEIRDFEGWMKDDKIMIACCTDAIHPVIFKIEKIDE
ncbi:TIGR04076 family protein [Methanobacterium sp.]|uniref:TIGR04076 family protein n=1 Tax=Methanobacterium sp. TaxID=2164 RepID=UPI003C717194